LTYPIALYKLVLGVVAERQLRADATVARRLRDGAAHHARLLRRIVRGTVVRIGIDVVDDIVAAAMHHQPDCCTTFTSTTTTELKETATSVHG
jgi:hypothetical protein